MINFIVWLSWSAIRIAWIISAHYHVHVCDVAIAVVVEGFYSRDEIVRE